MGELTFRFGQDYVLAQVFPIMAGFLVKMNFRLSFNYGKKSKLEL